MKYTPKEIIKVLDECETEKEFFTRVCLMKEYFEKKGLKNLITALNFKRYWEKYGEETITYLKTSVQQELKSKRCQI